MPYRCINYKGDTSILSLIIAYSIYYIPFDYKANAGFLSPKSPILFNYRGKASFLFLTILRYRVSAFLSLIYRYNILSTYC